MRGKKLISTYERELRVIGHRIIFVRKQLGISQAALSKKAGLSPKFLSLLENGANASMRTLFVVSEALGIDLRDLLRMEGLRPRGPGRPVLTAEADETLQDPVSRELLRYLALLDAGQRKRALAIIKTAFP
jgi:transcriptional regulator with XRE-family HTH domain